MITLHVPETPQTHGMIGAEQLGRMKKGARLINAARGTVVDRYPAPIEPRTLRLRRAKIAGLLGVAVPDGDVTRILESLGFTLRPSTSPGDGASLAASADGWEVTVPTRRVDVTREVDLTEEIARHYGFDRLPSTFPPLTAAPAPICPRLRAAGWRRGKITKSFM